MREEKGERREEKGERREERGERQGVRSKAPQLLSKPYQKMELRELSWRMLQQYLLKKLPPRRTYSRTMPRLLWRSWGVGVFL